MIGGTAGASWRGVGVECLTGNELFQGMRLGNEVNGWGSAGRN